MSSLYLHIPFCKQACHYCDFHFSTVLGNRESMIGAMQKELQLRCEELQGARVDSIYFGGGTPSLLTQGEFAALLNTITQHFKLTPSPEITVEANPDDLTQKRVEELAGIGVNRLSIGIQSFFDEDLRLMNRAHDAGQAERALELATDHFENYSLDLIYGIPGLDAGRWARNIEKALSFDPPHISSYALTVEPNTALAHFIRQGQVAPVDDGQAREHYHLLLDVLGGRGFVNYELSNFGRPGYFSRNNTAYWQGGSYMGIGPSAHSYDGLHRSWNVRNNPKYIRSIGDGILPREIETLSKTDRYNEYIMTGLRTVWGVSLSRVGADFGKHFHDYLLQRAQRFLEEGLLIRDGDVLIVGTDGKFVTDGIASDLFLLA